MSIGMLFSKTYNGSSERSYAAVLLLALIITYATRSPKVGADPASRFRIRSASST